MSKETKPRLFPIILFIVIYLTFLVMLILQTYVGSAVSTFWPFPKTKNISTSMSSEVVFQSFSCPLFIDRDGEATVSFDLKNKGKEAKRAGFVLLVTKPEGDYGQMTFDKRLRLDPGEKETFTWTFDGSNIDAKGRLMVRAFLGRSPDHPSYAVRSCTIFESKDPFSAGFLNTFMYPILLFLLLISTIILLRYSNLDWTDFKRRSFFIYSVVILLLMYVLLRMNLYTWVFLALGALLIAALGIVKGTPNLRASDYRKYLK